MTLHIRHARSLAPEIRTIERYGTSWLRVIFSMAISMYGRNVERILFLRTGNQRGQGNLSFSLGNTVAHESTLSSMPLCLLTSPYIGQPTLCIYANVQRARSSSCRERKKERKREGLPSRRLIFSPHP